MFKNKSNPASETTTPMLETPTTLQMSVEYDRSLPPLQGANKAEQQRLHAIVSHIRRAPSSEEALAVAVSELRSVLGCDRVSIGQVGAAGAVRVVAEAIAGGYTPAQGQTLPLAAWGSEQLAEYLNHRYLELDLAVAGTPHQKQVLESLQVRSQVVVPILLNDYASDSDSYGLQRVWGFLTAQNCGRSHLWSDSEINWLAQVALELTLAIQPHLPLLQLVQNRDPIDAIERESRSLMTQLADEMRGQLQADRVMVFAYNPDWSGKVVAESVDGNWAKAGSRFDVDYSIDNSNYKPYYIASDVQAKGLTRCFTEILDSYQIRAYLTVPIVYNDQLLGLLGAYQNSGPRNWQKSEVEVMQAFASKFAQPLQQTLYQRNQAFQNKQTEAQIKREKGLTKMQERIRNARTEEAVLQVAVQESRKLFEVDRVAVYRFNPDWSGSFVSESAGAGWNSLMVSIPHVADTYLQRTSGGRYKDGGTLAIDDIYLSDHEACHIDLLEQFEARAYVIASVFGADKKLWGLIAIYQNDRSRKWQPDEVETLRQVGLQVGVAMEQIGYLQSLQQRSEQQQTLAKITDRIRQTLSVEGVFQNVTQELRTAMKADRSVVYQFNSDWSGQVVAEAVGSKWMALLVEQGKDATLTGQRNQSERCTLRQWGTIDNTIADTHLQETAGGSYAKGKKYTAVSDIYAQNFPECYLNSLEKYQAKAYVIAPIFQGDKLWGLLGIYQNDGPRHWLETDIDLVSQIATQLSVALQLSSYVAKVENQERELAASLERERSARENLEQEAVRVLMALEPSFRGDLTIRAPLSESEIGTIADGYNTTIQSLRNLVRQVQVSAAGMSDTCGQNNALVENLASQAQGEIDRLDMALTQVKQLSSSSEAVAAFASQIDGAVQAANNTVQAGDRLIENTVNEILEIRSTVSETGKKVKRLGETFQKISKVVSLVENFATQTNLLALNAAIEATRAGEYGKGFAVVADEVRSLAYQSANATTEISRLVDEIRSGTNEVTEAMEVGIAQVVQGTQLVNETRQTLSEIVTATSEIGTLVQSIAQAAQTQNQESQQLSVVMNDMAEIVMNTAESATQLSGSFKELLSTSENLQTSVKRFKVD